MVAKTLEQKQAEDLALVMNAISIMTDNDRVIGEELHKIILGAAPELVPRTWYGMPSYMKDSKIICFFRPGKRFNEHYVTLGFNDPANLDDGHMWPTNYAITELTPTVKQDIVKLIQKAVS